MNNYAALMIDVQASKTIPSKKREALQHVLNGSIGYFNELFKPALACDVVFSAGDEVQGLFRDPASAYLYYRAMLQFAIHFKIRGGVGIGGWDTRIEEAPSTAQDGSAYHRARAMIDAAKKSRLYDFMMDRGALPPEATVFANYSLGISARRTKSQMRLARCIEICSPILPSGGVDVLNARHKYLPHIADGLSVLEEEESLFTVSSDWLRPIYLLDWDGDAIDRLPNSISGFSYYLESHGSRTRQSIDRLMDGAQIHAERVAAVTYAQQLVRWGA